MLTATPTDSIRSPASGVESESLNAGWASALGDLDEAPSEGGSRWLAVEVPHNWEDYHSYAGQVHGNLHGTAWYRRKLELRAPKRGWDCALILFEGVGSYADVWLDGKHLASHAGGRTAFWCGLPGPVTDGAPGRARDLLVRAHHPEGILDLPHVCGGCWGAPNTEGNQPFGIHRPVSLEWSGPVRVLPFGLYGFVSGWVETGPEITVWVEAMNFSAEAEEARIELVLRDESGQPLHEEVLAARLSAGCTFSRSIATFTLRNLPRLWSPEDPYCHRLEARVRRADGSLSHQCTAVMGIRRIEWPRILNPNEHRGVRCVPAGVEMVDNGSGPMTAENNGFTEVTRPEAGHVRTAPCGVRILQRPVAGDAVECGIEVDLINDAEIPQMVTIRGEILNDGGTVFVAQFEIARLLPARARSKLHWHSQPLHFLQKWTAHEPYLYKAVIELQDEGGERLERSATTFGLTASDQPLNCGRPTWRKSSHPATTSEPHPRDLPGEEKVLRVNGRPVFIRGTAEYETLLGADHAFGDEQIRARVEQMIACGFNGFRDAHHPHNLRYYPYWDQAGILCWTQFGSHIWFDSDAFRRNFRAGVIEWVRERRAHPCIMAWGIQNESTLPEDFTHEICELIRAWDPTARSERLCLTCNGGKGGDWNVPQEWSGTYGGNFHDYDLESLQMVGEYGAWRLFGTHRDTTYRGDENDRSESWACSAMGTKVHIGEQQRDRAIGHWHWIFNTFPNPGRSPHLTEDHANGTFGSVNNKGLVTAWGEPSDLFYLFRAAYADPRTSPMVYVVSPTWHDRFSAPGRYDNLQVYSNCEEVELFCGMRNRSFGVRANPGPGLPFQWDGCEIDQDLIYAEARMGGHVVASHYIRQSALPPSDGWAALVSTDPECLAPAERERVLLALNCGGAAPWTDPHGTLWLPEADAARDHGLVFRTWAQQHPDLHPDTGSIGFAHTPIAGTPSIGCPLFTTYRYGRHQLTYVIPVPADLRAVAIECFFHEPWFGVGGGLDATGWRLFDMAINGETVLRDFDIWRAAGGRSHTLVKRCFEVAPKDGRIELSFPRVAANQALLAALRLAAR